MKKVIIYSGRFQPMLAHHAEVFRQLQAQFPDAEVYFGTSDKVEQPNSPFSFKEKQQIASALGIDPKRVLLTNRPYHQDDYVKYFDPDQTVIVFAVGEKDRDRFPFSNVDAKTGLDMTVRGEPRPKYFQKINTYNASPLPMSQRGYVTVAPTVMTGDQAASASAFRTALLNAPDTEAAKEIFTNQFGQFNNKVFNLIYNKVAGTQMSEQINQMRKLAGLPALEEGAPIEFSATLDPKQAEFVEPTKASMKYSIANRFPKGADIADPKVKQEVFLNALLRSPESLLGEISERLDPKDDTSLAISERVAEIQHSLLKSGGKLAALSKEDKEFVLELAGEAVKRMSLVAGDNSPAYSPGRDMEVEGLNLNIVRESYGVMEGSAGAVNAALRQRVITKHLELVSDYGLDAVMQAIDDEANSLNDLEEIGSSDISIWMQNVISNLEAGAYGAKRERSAPDSLGPQMPMSEDLTVRTIYDQDGVKITSSVDSFWEDDGSVIDVYVDGEHIGHGDYDLYSGFWISDDQHKSLNFRTPVDIAQHYKNSNPELGEAIKKAPFLDKDAEGYGNDLDKAMAIGQARGYVDQIKHLRFPNKPETMARAKDRYNTALDSVKGTPVGKFVKSRTGNGIVQIEGEEVTELKKNTLARYISKSATNMQNRSVDIGSLDDEDSQVEPAMKKIMNRKRGIDRAAGRLAGADGYLGEDAGAKISPAQRKQLRKVLNGQSLNLSAWATKILDLGKIKDTEATKLTKLTEGTMAHGIFSHDKRAAHVALRGINNVLRDALPASQATDILHRYVSDDVLADIVDKVAMLDHTTDMRKVPEFQDRLRELCTGAANALSEANLQENPLIALAAGGIARGLAGRAGASAIGQAVAGSATNAAVNKALDSATPVDEDDAVSGKELDALMRQLIDSELDLYTVMNHPATPAQKTMQPHMQKWYNDIARDFKLHPDDQHEEIFDLMQDWLPDLYDWQEDEVNEAVLDPAVKASVKALVQAIVDGDQDVYDVWASPSTPAQKALNPEINTMYDQVSQDHGLYPHDEFDRILEIVVDQLADNLANGEYDIDESFFHNPNVPADQQLPNPPAEIEVDLDEYDDDDDDDDFGKPVTRTSAEMKADRENPNNPPFDREFDRYLKARGLAEDDPEQDPDNDVADCVREIVSGGLDLYNAMAHPDTPAQTALAPKLQKMYDEIAGENGYHPDDDFEKILSDMYDRLDHALYSPKDLADLGESMINESEWTELYYRGKSIGYINDEGEASTRRQRAINQDEIDDFDPAAIKRILNRFGAGSLFVQDSKMNESLSNAIADLRKLAGLKESAPAAKAFALGPETASTRYPYNFKFPETWGNISWEAGVKKLNKLGLVPDLTHAELFSRQVTGPAQKALQHLMKVMVNAKVKSGMSLRNAQDAVSKEIWGVAEPNADTDLSHDYCLEFFDGIAVNNRLPKFVDALQQLKQEAVKIKATVDISTAREAYRDIKDFLKDGD